MTYNFQSRFVPSIRCGEKLSTIRRPRLDGKLPKVGDTLHLFTGMRTKSCLFIQDVRCAAVSRVVIDANGIRVNGQPLTSLFADDLARRDGFKDFSQMLTWFLENHELPFTGNLIEWRKS